MIAAADWAFRQRRNTMKDFRYSRGWERGWLPAGALEDVDDTFFWLANNALIWRGTEYAARALEAAGHAEAGRIRREADAFKADLIRGFEIQRQHTPLVRLRNGRWVPKYSSRLYLRGRDFGWIREVYEGAMYLLVSGLYDPNSKQGDWILNDYQDNLYPQAPFGYNIENFKDNWFSRGGSTPSLITSRTCCPTWTETSPRSSSGCSSTNGRPCTTPNRRHGRAPHAGPWPSELRHFQDLRGVGRGELAAAYVRLLQGWLAAFRPRYRGSG